MNKGPLAVAFIDFEKAFDSIALNTIWQGLSEQATDSGYIEVLRKANRGFTTETTLFDDPI